ncbi:MAG: CHAP domain-containing protein [Oscillospiraceae bacterium]|jgi:hypothetical protein|nr:CHAP domain-containing protein [Oscillospiraceae bacterium]
MSDTVIGIARGFVGTTESPSGSNNVIFNTHYYGKAVSGGEYKWCAVFVWDVFRLAGASALYYGGAKTASCAALYDFGRRNGLLVTPGKLRRGDLAFFCWTRGGTLPEHVGIVTDVSAHLLTIEGNTGSGSDSNGGAVLERERALDYVVGGYRPNYAVPAAPSAAEVPAFDAKLVAAEVERYLSVGGTGAQYNMWAKPAVDWCLARGVFEGDGAGNFGWKKPLSREAAAQVIYNIFSKGVSYGDE